MRYWRKGEESTGIYFFTGLQTVRQKLCAFVSQTMYNTFSNPATGTFAWVGAEEGDIVHLPAPINFSKRDVELTRDILVFATANTPIVFIYFGGQFATRTLKWRMSVGDFFFFGVKFHPQNN